jgi:Fe-S-cluster-containing dehydrogenase component
LACSLYHAGECNLSLARLVVTKDMARYEFQILVCQHCDSPDCLAACPSEAMALDDRGAVMILDEACLRCGACAAACPYHAIFYDEATDTYLKCNLCAGREEGPWCVQLCPVGALTLLEESIGLEG